MRSPGSPSVPATPPPETPKPLGASECTLLHPKHLPSSPASPKPKTPTSETPPVALNSPKCPLKPPQRLPHLPPAFLNPLPQRPKPLIGSHISSREPQVPSQEPEVAMKGPKGSQRVPNLFIGGPKSLRGSHISS